MKYLNITKNNAREFPEIIFDPGISNGNTFL